MRRLKVVRIVSATVTVIGLGAAVLLCTKLISRARAELRDTTRAHAQRISAQVQAGVPGAFEPLERLGQWWLTQGKPMVAEDWATDGQLFLSRSPGLREAFWVAPEGRQLWSAAPGSAPRTREERPADRARELIAECGSGVPPSLSEVFEAPGTGPAVYGCYPVRTGGRVRGYVVGLYDARALVSSFAAGSSLGDQRIRIAANGREVFASGPSPTIGYETAIVAMQVAGRPWKVELDAPLHYFREFSGQIAAVVGVIGALIYSFVILLAVSQRSASALERANEALKTEVEHRTRTEEAVSQLNLELSRKVADFETLLDVIPIGIAVADDADCRSVRVNRALAGMLGVPRNANISRSIPGAAALPYRTRRDARDLAAEELPMQVAAATGKVVLGQQDQIVRADGAVLEVLSFAAPVFDEEGRVRGVLNACVDISERKRFEGRLRRAERMKSLGAMAAGIAHDFNNLLTSIIGQASLATELVPPGGEAARHIGASLEAAQQAGALVQKVLAYTGHSHHTLRPTNLGKTIETLQNSLVAMAGGKTAIRVEVAPELPEVRVDADEVRQMVRNVVMNAVEAAPAFGRIEIKVDGCTLTGREPHLVIREEAFRPGIYVRIAVKDSGPGMEPNIAEKAFDPFFSTKFLGRGLGLSEVLGIMRAHNGAVRLATAPKEGTTVELFFPGDPPAGGLSGNPKLAA